MNWSEIEDWPEDIMEGDILAVPHLLNLTAHVFVEQVVLLHVHLQPASQQPQHKLDSAHWDHPLHGAHTNKQLHCYTITDFNFFSSVFI